VGTTQIVKMNMRHVVPAKMPFAIVLEETNVTLADTKVKKAKIEKMTIETSRMSFASMGCMLSSMRKRPCGNTIKHHV
jgi:hypothetical protein